MTLMMDRRWCEIASADSLKRYLAEHDTLVGVVFQGMDLTAWTKAIAGRPLDETVFLGCTLSPQLLAAAQASGALIFPRLSGLPYQPYRGELYSPEVLYAGFDRFQPSTYAGTFDARVYAHWKETGGGHPQSIVESLARRIHDHAMTDALSDLLVGGRQVVAIMGGHSMARDDSGYRATAQIARALTREGFFMASGGGPGAMEATNLGAFLAPHPDAALDRAIDLLAEAPTYTDERWLAAAFDVRAEIGTQDAGESLGIPTWHYGHEPPNAFATHVAKYFENSVREEGLLAIATHGVVFTPGSAGTIQEVFQDACQNHYVSFGVVSPMVFYGIDYWTQTKPVYPLMTQLAEGREYAKWLSIADDSDTVVQAILAYRDRDRTG